jgi:hypothetical protein
MAKNPEYRATVPQETFEKLATIQNDEGLNTKTETLEYLLESYYKMKTKNGPSITEGLSEELQAQIDKAVKSGANLQELMVIGLLAEVKRWNSTSEKRSNFADLSYRELMSQRVKGAAEERIERALKATIAHNESCESSDDKLFITTTVIFRITNANRKALLAFFNRKDVIKTLEEHHQKHGLTEDHNARSMVNVGDVVLQIQGALMNS